MNDPIERQPNEEEAREAPKSETADDGEGLASLVGTHSDDPNRQDIQKYIQEYRHQIDEANKG